MDPGTHIKTCTAGDDFKVEAHDFNAWTPNSDDTTTHSRTCYKCKKSGETTSYTETANHNWQWVVDTPATPNADGKQHEECVDCHAVKAGSETVIPMLISIMVEHLTVAKPVKDAAAMEASTTDTAYYVAATEWMAADGTNLAIGDKFQPGTVYTVKITLETAGNGVFSANSTYNTIEGKTATVSPALTGDAHADSVILTYTFDATEGTSVPTEHTVTVPASNVEVEATFKAAKSGNPFVDVPSGAYYEDAVIWAVDKGVTSGTDAAHFTPNGVCTRAQAVTFLWRAAGSPAPKSTTMPFTDVAAGSYYEQAVLWAVENGITKGTSDTPFSPNATCSRAQIVTFLWRSQKSPAAGSVNPFTDVSADAYYADAVLWAVKENVTSGTTAATFSPSADCTRAQIVTFIYRALAE